MKKKILIIDDSALMRRVLCDIINSDDRFEVTDIAHNGEEGLALIGSKSYDAVVMDMVMPKMDGITVLKKLQADRKRVRVLVFSSETTEGANITMEALELGAIDFVHKPESIMGAHNEAFAKDFINRLSEVVASRIVTGSVPKLQSTPRAVQTAANAVGTPGRMTNAPRAAGGRKAIAIAASTGGPRALQSVIPFLPKEIQAPVLVVQHMPAGFTASLAERLNQQSQLHVVEAAEAMEVVAGTVYIAPGGKHMHVVEKRGGHFIHLTDGPHREGVKPSANFVYESLAECGYDSVVCVVMTGMGADGSEGIKNLKSVKPVYTITQEQSTCAVYGMPKAAVTNGLSDEVEPLENLASAITKQVGVK